MKNYDLTLQSIKQLNGLDTAISTNDINIFYDDKQAIFNASLSFPKNSITSLIGASGSGKSTYLRSLNRMNDGIATVNGKIIYHDTDINQKKIDVYHLRRYIGMVFQNTNAFYKSIYDNIAFPLKEAGFTKKKEIDQKVMDSLKQAALWDEVKDNLKRSALSLSGGQQQRLCIARTLSLKPDIILLDEPTSALDPISIAKFEETLMNLKQEYTIIMVTHSMQQASRISDYTALFHLGHVVEFDTTKNIFTNPTIELTEDYISGNFG